MADPGWIKLHRKFNKWEWKSDPNMVALFVHLLLNANFEDSNWMGSLIRRGQIVTGRMSLAEKTGISQQSLRTCLKRLKSTNEITIKSTNHHSIITICNYDEYQTDENTTNQQTNQQNIQPSTSHQPAINQQLTTYKEEKEEKEIYNTERGAKKFAPPSIDILEAFISENNLSVVAQKFLAFYESKGWMVGKTKMKDWKAAVRNWHYKSISEGGNNLKPHAKSSGRVNDLWIES